MSQHGAASRQSEDGTAAEASVASSSRRSFLHRSLATGAAAVPAALLATSAGVAEAKPPARGNVPAHVPSLYPGLNARSFREIRSDEDTHVNFLVSALNQLGGARPKPTFIDLRQRSAAAFFNLSQVFENTGVGAYQGAAPFIQDKTLLADAASIAFVEAYHSGYLNTLLDGPIVPGGSPFSLPLTFDAVAAKLAPFIVSLNDPNGQFPLPTATNPATITDLNILNFALIAEYLEREFYDINVPRFFG